MHPQLQAVAGGLLAAQARLHRLAEVTAPESWAKRADPGRWSAGECVAHLNLTAIAFLPLIRAALTEAAARGGAPVRFRRDLIGWLLWRTAGPPVRLRVRTAAPFVPTGTEPVSRLLTTFDRLQQEQLDLVTQADGRALHRVKVTSPFDSRIRCNLYACLTILPAHQEREQHGGVWRGWGGCCSRTAKG